MTTFSSNLGIELIGTGEQAGTWGVTTNTNLGTLLEQSIAGYVTQAVTDSASPTVLTIPNGATGVARNMYIELTGTLTAARVVEVPNNKKLYFIFNNTKELKQTLTSDFISHQAFSTTSYNLKITLDGGIKVKLHVEGKQSFTEGSKKVVVNVFNNSLDILVTSCTSTAHLAGAMGIRAIVIVPIVPYFVWASDDLLWYGNNITVIRQTKYNDWADVIESLNNELSKFCSI